MPKGVQVLENAPKVEKLCPKLRKCSKRWESIKKCAKSWENAEKLRMCAKSWESMRKFAICRWKRSQNPGSKFHWWGGGVKVSPSTAFCCQKVYNHVDGNLILEKKISFLSTDFTLITTWPSASTTTIFSNSRHNSSSNNNSIRHRLNVRSVERVSHLRPSYPDTWGPTWRQQIISRPHLRLLRPG